jgi:hypothetical protein
MAERAPNDGHLQNIIKPEHNFVGLGLAIHGGQFRYYEEFLDRYLDFSNVPARAAVGSEFTFRVRPLREDDYVYAITVYHEPFPSPMTPAQINSRGSYGDFTSSRVLSKWPWELKTEGPDGEVNISMSFDRPGLYYIQIYIHDEPYSTQSASTRGKIQASGVVVQVR